jgi:hypothetical protein
MQRIKTALIILVVLIIISIGILTQTIFSKNPSKSIATTNSAEGKTTLSQDTAANVIETTPTSNPEIIISPTQKVPTATTVPKKQITPTKINLDQDMKDLDSSVKKVDDSYGQIDDDFNDN